MTTKITDVKGTYLQVGDRVRGYGVNEKLEGEVVELRTKPGLKPIAIRRDDGTTAFMSAEWTLKIPAKPKARVFKHGGYGVDVKLNTMETTTDVFWIRGNSYVLVAEDRGHFKTKDGTRVAIVSVNGIGEVRWVFWESSVRDALRHQAAGTLNESWDCASALAAFNHFNLQFWE